MNKEFIPEELESELLKSGYNYETNTHILWQQAFRWLREKHNSHALIMPKTTPSNTTVYYIYKGKFEENWDNCFEVYEEAELACLREMIKLVKK